MDTKLVFLAVAACVLNACGAWRYYDHEYDKTPLGDAIDKASMKMLKEGFDEVTDKNVIASPLGVLLLLSLYSAGAGRASKEEIYRLLGESETQKVFDSYSGLSERFSAMDPSYLTFANKIYVSNEYTLANSFAQVARYYRSDVENIDFSKPQEAAATINKWANDKTQGHIKEPVSSDAIRPDVAVALINVIFFKGHWHVPFNASETQDKDFHVDKSTTVKKPTMRLYRSLFYYDSKDLGAQLIELPYKEAGFRMVVVLPKEVDGLPSLLGKVAQKGVLADVFELRPTGNNIDLDMPKFEIKSKWDLESILVKVGVSSIFTENATWIVKDDELIVDKVFQEAFVKVDEEGATAGAFTGLVAFPVSSDYVPPPPLVIKVDHPFLFLILHEDKILFTGTYTH